jgi:gluconokinase
MEGYGAHLAYTIKTTPDGGAEIDPEELANLAIDCLDELHRQVREAGFKIAAIASSAFWHSFCGVSADGRPTFPILHLLDTRGAGEVERVPNAHGRTGAIPHSSYWPAKLLWLARTYPDKFAATAQWLSFPEYLFKKFFGRARVSISMVSGTGLWNQAANDYDAETLAALAIRREQLADPAAMDEPERDFLPAYRAMWPCFQGVPWFPAIGDGAANHIGSGCTKPDQFSLMVGTTGAMRALLPSLDRPIPDGLWCYRLDRSRLLMGGALSNGGNVYAWLKQTLQFPKQLEARLESAAPGSHGLTVLPFLAGERSPYWRSDLRGAMIGLTLATEPVHILQASLESVALRFGEIYSALSGALGVPAEVIASGGALLRSPAWTQMMTDVIGRPLTAATEQECSSRGAALYAWERLGVIRDISSMPGSLGATFEPRTEHAPAYDRLRSEQNALFEKLFGAKK